MQKIIVDLGENSYNIIIEDNSLAQCGKQIRQVTRATKAALISDSNVYSLYGELVRQSLEQVGLAVTPIVITPGESSKNLTTLGQVYDQLAAAALTRSDIVVTLGGGVVGDLGGLAAATYLRGVDFVQLPTSLLAQIDSSVGGKVAVDLAAGKNLVGAFYQPKLVLIDPTLLQTLPLRYLHDGLAEAIKYGCIGDAQLFALLQSIKSDAELLSCMEKIVAVCCAQKALVVEADEHDTGERMVLNFGHTIGHAVEKCFHYDKYTHGEAVGIGMVRITEQTEKLGLTPAGTASQIKALLEQFDLPTTAAVTAEDIVAVAALDKKKQGQQLTLVILRELGQAVLQKINCSELQKYVG